MPSGQLQVRLPSRCQQTHSTSVAGQEEVVVVLALATSARAVRRCRMKSTPAFKLAFAGRAAATVVVDVVVVVEVEDFVSTAGAAAREPRGATGERRCFMKSTPALTERFAATSAVVVVVVLVVVAVVALVVVVDVVVAVVVVVVPVVVGAAVDFTLGCDLIRGANKVVVDLIRGAEGVVVDLTLGVAAAVVDLTFGAAVVDLSLGASACEVVDLTLRCTWGRATDAVVVVDGTSDMATPATFS